MKIPVEEQYKFVKLTLPDGSKAEGMSVLLHACCAPCSSAMDKINLHFTGDFHSITEANNMIAALLDNYRFQHEAEGFKLKKILWRRVMDVNDRGLRRIITGIGDKNGIETEAGLYLQTAALKSNTASTLP